MMYKLECLHGEVGHFQFVDLYAQYNKWFDSIPSMTYGRYIHIFVQNCRTILKIPISQQIPSHCSYLLVRRVPTPETQLRWQVTGGCERSSSVQIWPCPDARAWNAEVPPGKVVPRGCK